MYEAKDEKTCMALISLQPLVADQASMPHMKAMDVPFHLLYSSPIYLKGLQSERPICLASFVDPRWTPKYDHKIPISWTMGLIVISAGSP